LLGEFHVRGERRLRRIVRDERGDVGVGNAVEAGAVARPALREGRCGTPGGHGRGDTSEKQVSHGAGIVRDVALDCSPRLPRELMSRHLRCWLWPASVALTVWTSHPAAASRQQPDADPLRVVLERAAAAVALFEREFAAVVAEEHFEQRVEKYTVLERRETRSDLLLVQVPGHDGWLPFRDVFVVDARAVRDRSERLQKLFLDAPETALTNATRISNESSRYNIGPVVRTINTPTFGLMLLRPSYAARLTFRKRGEEVVAGERTWRITFVERVRPTIVRTLPRGGEDVPLEGTLWIEPSSGRVIKTLVRTIGTPDPGSLLPVYSAQTLMWVEVTFTPSETLGFLVPEKMTEWARAIDRTQVTGIATYSRFRRFTVRTTETLQGDLPAAQRAGTPAGGRDCVPLGTPKPSLEFSYRRSDS